MLTCPCGAAYRAEALDYDLDVGRCAACGVVSALSEAVIAGPDAVRVQVQLPRELRVAVARPSAWTEQVSDAGLLLSRRSLGGGALFAVPFLVVCGVMLGFSMQFGAAGWLFFMVVGGLGLSQLYVLLAGILNSTVVEVRDDVLRAWTGPLPWPRAVSVPAVAVKRITVLPGAADAWGHQRLQLMLTDDQAVDHVLLDALADENEGLFLKYRLEESLGLWEPEGRA